MAEFNLSDPPSWTLWFAVIASVLLVMQRIITPIWNFFKNKAARRLAVVDDFWYRKILMPQCMTPLQKFFEDYGERLQSLNKSRIKNPTLDGIPSPEYQKYVSEFQQEKERLVRQFFVLRAIDSEIHEQVAQFLDRLEDHVTEFCYKIAISSNIDELEVSAVESAFWAINRDIIESMIGIHRKLS